MPLSVDEQLLSHRNAIDSIDAEIPRLLSERAGHTYAIGELKGTGAVYRPGRGVAVSRRTQDLNRGPLSDESVTRLFRKVMSECLAVERPPTTAYLGSKGTSTRQAAIKHFGHVVYTMACTTIDSCFKQIETRQTDYLVAPVENLIKGSVGRTLDLLAVTVPKVCGEVIVRTHHNLLRKDSYEIGGITEVFAHTQVLVQCDDWLDHSLPNAECIAAASNVEAARSAAESDSPNVAVIVGCIVAEIYQLSLAAECIEDESNNTMRFLVMGHQDTGRSGNNKTSLVTSVPNRAGVVTALLQPFIELGISMIKSEGRPSKSVLWEYLSLIDIEGHQSDEDVQKALQLLDERVSFVKVVGSYPIVVL